ncbi:hypothetical protein LDG_6315 [Legionella drancourtii LLAP12]|uniref:Uncharacterized protein n=1 Tax=Legionella drancourtii LLAP12 TaxID=658187 RepID=G9EM53_9GAMM|nr:hypothetical protein LDG_6315 [Legionella drancourtii LLAP12]
MGNVWDSCHLASIDGNFSQFHRIELILDLHFHLRVYKLLQKLLDVLDGFLLIF